MVSPETSYAWRHQLPALAAAGWRAVAPDMRGYGQTQSPKSVESFTVFHLVGDMVALLDALGEESAVIVGNDWGATVAWQAGLMRPDRFSWCRSPWRAHDGTLGLTSNPPSSPQTSDELFYTLYFQKPGLAEEELQRNPASTLRKILYAASGDAGSS